MFLGFIAFMASVSTIALTVKIWWNSHQHENELSDVGTIHHEVAKVYAHVTGGMICKATYHSSWVIAAADTELARVVEEETAALRKEIEQLTQERDHLLDQLGLRVLGIIQRA